MSDRDDEEIVGKFNKKKFDDFNKWIDDFHGPLADFVSLAFGASAYAEAMAAGQGDELEEGARTITARLNEANDAMTAVLGAQPSDPGFTAFAFSHKRRVSKKVESRQ